MTINKLADKISDVLLAILISFSLIFALTSSLCLIYPATGILLLTVLCVALYCAMFYNKTASIVSFSAIGLTLLVLFIYIVFGMGFKKLADFFNEYSLWLGDFITYPDPEIINASFQFITVITLCIAISLFSYCFVVRKFRFYVVFITGVAVFGIQWSYGIVSSLAPFYFFLVAALMVYLKHVYRNKLSKEPNDYARPAQIAVWSLPICIIVIALAFTIHASDKPIEWKWLDKKIVSVYNYFKRNYDYETFDYFSLSASSGFGDRNNILGGRVKLDRTNVLQVSTGKRVYLKGASYDTYTGSSWINSKPSLEPEGSDFSGMYSDTDEMLEGMKILTGKDDFLSAYFDENPVSVVFLNIKTKSLFIPSKTKNFKTSSKDFSTNADSNGDYSSKQRLTRGFRYSMDMYSPKIGSGDFADIMRKSKRGLYSEALVQMKFPTYFKDVLDNILRNGGYLNSSISSNSGNSTTSSALDTDATVQIFTPGTDGAGNSAAEGSGNSSDNASNNTSNNTSNNAAANSSANSGTSLTTILTSPDKIKKFETLTKLKENSNAIYKEYLKLPENLPQRIKDLSVSLVSSETNDYDKAKAIEQYLASKYPYNLDVRSTPRNRDFVDYFLFDLKEGYCSYYASAMTILARCAGLPARYVEGYMLPPEPVKDNKSTYIVSNLQAHAWVEVYFEGYGWLPFEPTSPFRSNFYATDYSDISYSESYSSAYADYMEDLMKRYNQQGRDFVDDFDYVAVKKGPSAVIIVLYSFAGLFVLLLALLVTNIIRNRLRLYKIFNLPANECVLKFYDYYLDVLGMQGLGLQPSETPFQYSARIDSFLFFSPVRFKVITDIFVKSRYSTELATENEKQLFCDFHPGFQSEIKINMGKLKFFILKYLLGKF